MTIDQLKKQGYPIHHENNEQLRRRVVFTGAGFYSLDDRKVYRRGRFATFSRLFIGERDQ
jgi:hypothetical protein